VVTQTGGDIWYECARADQLGILQRRAFREAAGFFVSNPWSFAHARRYRFDNLVFMPLILDQDEYAPGPPKYRDEWKQRVGGSFFVLSTARMDNYFKGSHLALEAFAQFSRRFPEARLVLMQWGEDAGALLTRLKSSELDGKVLVLPIAGKKRLVEYLRSADCLLDQFVLGYYGATALEAMACGLPTIMRLESIQYQSLCDTGAPPVHDASTVPEIVAWLEKLASDADAVGDSARRHRQWFLENHGSAKWGPRYMDFLQAVALGFRPDFRSSPLRAPLSDAERAYQANELRHAPTFPSYF
jgi:glycosyltransferase involved in cell wall biosynthesis